MTNHNQFPMGAKLTLAALSRDVHPWLHALRRHEPVSWVPVLNAWLVTRYDLATAVSLAQPQGLLFRKPAALHVQWQTD